MRFEVLIYPTYDLNFQLSDFVFLIQLVLWTNLDDDKLNLLKPFQRFSFPLSQGWNSPIIPNPTNYSLCANQEKNDRLGEKCFTGSNARNQKLTCNADETAIFWMDDQRSLSALESTVKVYCKSAFNATLTILLYIQL